MTPGAVGRFDAMSGLASSMRREVAHASQFLDRVRERTERGGDDGRVLEIQ